MNGLGKLHVSPSSLSSSFLASFAEGVEREGGREEGRDGFSVQEVTNTLSGVSYVFPGAFGSKGGGGGERGGEEEGRKGGRERHRGRERGGEYCADTGGGGLAESHPRCHLAACGQHIERPGTVSGEAREAGREGGNPDPYFFDHTTHAGWSTTPARPPFFPPSLSRGRPRSRWRCPSTSPTA